MCIFFPDKPPDAVKAKGARGQQQQAMLDLQANPYGFALGLKDAPCKVLTIDAAQILHTCHARVVVRVGVALITNLHPHPAPNPTKEPVCCVIATCGSPCGLTACWARKVTLSLSPTLTLTLP